MAGDIADIISKVEHRPFPMPAGRWRYYQEWNHALFLHWQVPVEIIRKLIPEPLEVDCFNGDCYVSLVAFTMQNIRPRGLPAVKFISDFHEINIRAYVKHDNKSGVYFLNIEAEKYLSVWIAKKMSGLPYRKSIMRRNDSAYHCDHPSNDFTFEAKFSIGEPVKYKTELDVWLTERYCLYLDEGQNIFRYDVHHKPWPLKTVAIKQLGLKYSLPAFNLSAQLPTLTHYSDGVKVLAWKKTRIRGAFNRMDDRR